MSDWTRLNRLFDEAVTLAPEERSAFLARACPEGTLRQELDSLLAAHDRADDVLRPIDRLAEAAPVPPRRAGTKVGPYRVLRELGRGGMGVVYEAEDTRLRRPVALKFLPPHLHASAPVQERFLVEARAASSLDHPNLCTIYEIGEAEGQRYIAMAYYAGETLRQKLERGPLPLHEAVGYARQMAAGLAEAHAHGILHRDVKPDNVIVTRDGTVKIIDFGVAKMVEATQALTGQGATLGTVGYMSPEQTHGRPVDVRTDVWSLGVVLYEMLTGTRPFRGPTPSVVIHAIQHEAPPPVDEARDGVPPPLEALLGRMLAKDPADRMAAMADVEAALSEGAGLRVAAEAAGPRTVRRRPRILAAAAVALLVVAAVAFPYWQRAQTDRARALLPEIERLAEAERFAEAYALAEQAERHLGDDPALTALWPSIADRLTLVTDPPGATVTVQRFAPAAAGEAPGAPPAARTLGRTPLMDYRVPRGAYRLQLRKEGYAPAERVVTRHLFDPAVRLERTLVPADQVPEGMVFVPGGPYRLGGWDPPTDEAVPLADFFIDRHEVSNRDYQAFVDAGGYRTRAYWQHPFEADGRRLAWAEAVARFTDRTGLPGPRGWSDQTYPPGAGDRPVTGVSWHEAAAYAAWAGKRLPTVYEWQRAARADTTHPFGIMMPWGSLVPGETADRRAHFHADGPAAVDAYPFGMSPYGAYNMAGNVQEWTANARGGGFATAGGAWSDPEYAFGYIGTADGFHAAPTLGFRCAVTAGDAAGDQGAGPLPPRPAPADYAPVDAASFEGFLSHFRYDRRPLEPERVATDETPAWRRETVTFTGAYGEELLAYLYLPRHAAPPYQTLVFAPPYPVYAGWRSIADEAERDLGPHIRAGRAVLAVVPLGGLERPHPPGYEHPPRASVRYRALAARWASEYGRGLDYLATRDDIDPDRIAHLSFSAGGTKLLFPAVDPRYRAIILMGAGLRPGDADRLPEANPVNFVPHYRAPVLLLNGRYDEIEAYEVHARPLFDLLPEPKELVLVESGHVPPLDVRAPIINAWLDETLGPVRRR